MARRNNLSKLSTWLMVPLLWAAPASAQDRRDPAASLVAQREALKQLSALDGVWRGSAWTLLPGGARRERGHTQRGGPMLDGAIRVVEGRGYEADGRLAFNAFAVISFDPDSRRFSLRSWAQGQFGEFPLQPTEAGYTWEIPAGPATVRYTATLRDGVLHEVGDRLLPGGATVRFFEMTLRRVGDSGWPAAGAVAPQ
jgi:hypothetical protein